MSVHLCMLLALSVTRPFSPYPDESALEGVTAVQLRVFAGKAVRGPRQLVVNEPLTSALAADIRDFFLHPPSDVIDTVGRPRLTLDASSPIILEVLIGSTDIRYRGRHVGFAVDVHVALWRRIRPDAIAATEKYASVWQSRTMVLVKRLTSEELKSHVDDVLGYLLTAHNNANR